MPDEKFRLPRSSYDQVARIIQAYGQFSVEASLDEVANIAGILRTVVSANNGFLADTGIVTGGNKKVLSDRGRSLARALEYDNEDEITRLWREIITDTDFFRSVLSAVRIRRGMDEANLQSHIAYSAGLPKNKGVMTGAAAVIDILERAGLLQNEDGTFVAVPTEGLETRDVSVVAPPAQATAAGKAARVSVRGYSAPELPAAGASGVQIQIQIQVKAGELDGLGEKLRTLLDDLSHPDAPDSEA